MAFRNQYRPRSKSFDNSSLQQYIDSVSQDYPQNYQYDYQQPPTPAYGSYAYSHSSGQSNLQQNTSSTSFQKPQTPLTGQKCGWLTKMGHIVPSWKSRWFVLDQGKLYYYSSNSDSSTLKGTVEVQGGAVDNASSYVNKLNCFHVQSPNGKHLYAYSKDPSDAASWMEALCSIGGARQVDSGLKGKTNTTTTKSFTTNNNNNSESTRSNTITSTYQPPNQDRGRPRSQSDPQAPQSPPRPSFSSPPPRKATTAPAPQRAPVPSRTQNPFSQPPAPVPQRQPVGRPSLPPREPVTPAPAPTRQPSSQSPPPRQPAPAPTRQPVPVQRPPGVPQRQPALSQPPLPQRQTTTSQQKACPTCSTLWALNAQFCGSCGNRF